MSGSLLVTLIAAVLSTSALALYRLVLEDRAPWLSRTMTAIGACGFVLFAVWAAFEAPVLFFIAIASFVALNLLDGMLSTLTRLKYQRTHLRVWEEATAELRSLGWIHVGTWQLEIAGKYPEMTVLDRPDRKARVLALGTAAQGGIVEVQTHLVGGLLSTINKRSRLIRPAWMFKQTFRGMPIGELARSHEQALGYLEAMGLRTTPYLPEHPLELMRAENLALRTSFIRRWWLVAIQPIIVYLTPSRSRPLHEQSDIDRQIERFRETPAPVLVE